MHSSYKHRQVYLIQLVAILLYSSIPEQLTKSIDVRSVASIDEDNCVPIVDGIGIGICNVYFSSLVNFNTTST